MIVVVDASVAVHNRILAFPIQSYLSQALGEEAFQMAIETKRSIYDCLYLALAEALECRMVTADRRFFQALQNGPLSSHLFHGG